MSSIDYLCIGHVSRDLTSGGPTLGGTVTFGALMAHALGLRVGLVTSAPDDMESLLAPLYPVAEVVRIPAQTATSFTNTYTAAGRVQILSGQAIPLTFDHVPKHWRNAPIVHLGPIADDVDPALATQFPRSLIGVTPQGWMRQWDERGYVRFKPWQSADTVLSQADAVVMSIEDVQSDETVVDNLGMHARVLIVTQGSAGSTLFVNGQSQPVPSAPQPEVDPTGAGDIFATAFFFRLNTTGDPIRAARFATLLASESVRRPGIAAIPSPHTIQNAIQKA